MKRMTILLLPILLLAASGCGNNSEQANIEAGAAVATDVSAVEAKITNVEVMTLKPSVFEEYLTLPVIVSPYRQANLGLTAGGRITKLNIDKGDKVRSGAVLLKTDDLMLKANMNITSAMLEYQEKEYARSEQLFGDGSISEAIFDAFKLQLAQAKSAYEIAKKQYEDATLKAPFSGIITMRNVEVGDILGPGTSAFRLVDMSRVKIQTGIPEKYITDFKIGNDVAVEFDALPGKLFKGRIDYVSPEATPSVRTFLAEIVTDNSDGQLRAGIMGNAKILKAVHEDALMIPLNSVIDTQHGRIIFVAKSDNMVEQRRVEIGRASDTLVQALSGVNAGDRVISRGQYDLLDGEEVTVTGEYDATGEESQ